MSVWHIVLTIVAVSALALSTMITVMYFLDYRASEVVSKASDEVQSLSSSAPLNTTVVTAADVQTLTNKILTDESNVLYATALRNSDGVVGIDGGAPSTNQVLMATSDTTAEWKELSLDPLDINNGTIDTLTSTDLTATAGTVETLSSTTGTIGALSSTTGTIGTLTSTTGTISALTTTSFTMATGATNGYVLTSNGSGVGSWAAASSGTTYVEIDLTASVTTNAYDYDSGTVFIIKQSVDPGAQYTARFDVTESGTTATVGTTYHFIAAIAQGSNTTRLLFLDENGADSFDDICNAATGVTNNASPWSPVNNTGDMIVNMSITYTGDNVWIAYGTYSD